MAAEQIAVALWDAESAVDLALTKTANFTGTIPALRRQAGASALIGQEAMERASQAVMALAEARRALVEAHKELTIAKQQVGLGAVTMDDTGGNKPPIHIEATAVVARNRGRALRAVSAA
ncbi:MAG TPA: hypothetical protein VJS38_02385 [Phenylobacterium sp.]|uniref:hypothetical protein n=1 Tax=Phenylobacterium sp. TaxID=1871053 RepID=UPI002B472072|nr:hypothetical protein [Phenylobacterium sp.]HKR86996.1 hypothetical protein [Phenylobacterium sp.]